MEKLKGISNKNETPRCFLFVRLNSWLVGTLNAWKRVELCWMVRWYRLWQPRVSGTLFKRFSNYLLASERARAPVEALLLSLVSAWTPGAYRSRSRPLGNLFGQQPTSRVSMDPAQHSHTHTTRVLSLRKKYPAHARMHSHTKIDHKMLTLWA